MLPFFERLFVQKEQWTGRQYDEKDKKDVRGFFTRDAHPFLWDGVRFFVTILHSAYPEWV
ncbi:hypothetical protein KDH_31440 [Dictyobacter sp. S3.2.2.5]|uniref:Uncharacterized protein n=1 Tax=Dictyobacter halimunensis TaxID=3026934 RepID=A0ABQ6FRJ1_9CHLR|nr:hypothetical protein KDH_31440 [Dictyobacter sp. S3.2.2.5]